jgi:AraC family transcriptional regulator of adaptative response / DNA-3-methyladenine glycosylase II
VDSLARLAQRAAGAIDAGAVNGRTLREFASDFGVSDRHLRRALLREFGRTARDLTGARRLSLAHRLLVTTNLRVIQIAYASGFRSLRRFNAAFRDTHRMSPTEARRSRRA